MALEKRKQVAAESPLQRFDRTWLYFRTPTFQPLRGEHVERRFLSRQIEASRGRGWTPYAATHVRENVREFLLGPRPRPSLAA